MFERKVQPGDHVIDQGDDGDNFYVIDKYVWHFVYYDVKQLHVKFCHGCGSLKKVAQQLQAFISIYKPLQSWLISTFLNPVSLIYYCYFN